MKEKRYFCDFWEKMSIFFYVVSVIIVSNVSYITLSVRYENELNSYSKDTYLYLEEIADQVIQEGIGINLLGLPDDVSRYSITNDTENGKMVEFKYYLDNNKDMIFARPSNMKVEISKDTFEIISKIPDCSSKEDYVRKVRTQMGLASAMFGFVFGLIVIIISEIFAFISRYIKETKSFVN